MPENRLTSPSARSRHLPSVARVDSVGAGGHRERSMAEQEEISRLLQEAARGNAEGLDRLVPVVYHELRRIAHRQLRGERSDHTLDTTALVHEAYIKLTSLDRIAWRDRGHFLAVAAG